MSIAVLQQCKPPDRLFSPLDTSSLTVWPSTGRAKSGKESVGDNLNFQGVEREPRELLGRGKRLNCALRVWKGRAVRWMRIHQVNLEYEQLVSNDWDHFLRIFYGEFDSGSERTLAACLRHASRTVSFV